METESGEGLRPLVARQDETAAGSEVPEAVAVEPKQYPTIDAMPEPRIDWTAVDCFHCKGKHPVWHSCREYIGYCIRRAAGIPT